MIESLQRNALEKAESPELRANGESEELLSYPSSNSPFMKTIKKVPLGVKQHWFRFSTSGKTEQLPPFHKMTHILSNQ